MPRKVTYGADYDDEYDIYDDYPDDNYDYNYGNNGVDEHESGWDSSEVKHDTVIKQQTVSQNVWRCPVCTFDNEEYMSACDICGVLRNPLVKSSNHGQSSTVAPNLNKPSTSGPPSSKATNNAKLKSSATRFNDSALSISKDKFELVEENVQSLITETQSHGLSSEINSMTVSEKSDNLIISSKEKIPRSEYKPDKWMLPDETEDRLSQLNLAIVGHVDSGKSTLSGRLLHLLGQISQKQMHKYEKEAKSQGKGSFAYAWALDESTEERERGITMTVAVAYFNSNKYHVVILDSPGHKDFVPNMISGATQADAAILVIDAATNAFEAGFGIGQTREHVQLIKSFGVDKIIVGVNKMDSVQYKKERFDFIKLKLGEFIRLCNFVDSSVSWIPLSAIENQNLVGPADDERFSWYKGPSLLEAIDALKPPVREYSKPLIMPICDVIKLQSQGQVSACGKLESGALRNGTKVLVMPSGEIGTVRSLERDSQTCSIARAGDNVAVSLQGIEPTSVISGGVLCHPDFPVSISNHLELKIVVLEVQNQMPILIGSQLEFHIHHAKEVAKVAKIVSLLNKKGEMTKKSPRCLLAKQSAIVEVILQGEVCVEEFSISRALGRVFLRSSGTTVAVGLVTRVITGKQN